MGILERMLSEGRKTSFVRYTTSENRDAGYGHTGGDCGGSSAVADRNADGFRRRASDFIKLIAGYGFVSRTKLRKHIGAYR